MDWAITIPKDIEWEDYEQELLFVEDWSGVLNYHVSFSPKNIEEGDRCFVVWRGKVRGWMEVVGKEYYPTGFTCETTGKHWPGGHYIQRSGPFHVVNGPEMAGFRGIRRINLGSSRGK